MKHVVITGANRGIGLELARHYHAEGWKVTGVCRESSPELEQEAIRLSLVSMSPVRSQLKN